ncbi:DNA-directed RNA polymerase III subunit rpc1 [Sphaceloma murrayae]|uniref:DNA-directed RNA polymerase III subunit rpc1 n=1 Tax=Sphaceloma murrayae TaxID=2082308 RepID=A0A2K1QJZ3_9PEZI|nr:DNA-directed RNA polymerase III subunit rpc1 [Sphaceloma murrayae]
MTWNDLPIELFELVLSYVYREDAKTLRLVNKSFEGKVSPFFFRSVVVPFNSELQDMVKRDIQARNGESGKGRGKRVAIDDDHVLAEESSLSWMQQPAGGDDTFRGHGYKVFSGFGRHIRSFGMSFEVTEDDLRRPPLKQLLDSHESFYGSYEWPPPSYRRFDKLASLERTADEMSHLRDAMKHLTGVRALGLSLNNGLGWLCPRERIITTSTRPRIFGNVFAQPPVLTPFLGSICIPHTSDRAHPGMELDRRADVAAAVISRVRQRIQGDGGGAARDVPMHGINAGEAIGRAGLPRALDDDALALLNWPLGHRAGPGRLDLEQDLHMPMDNTNLDENFGRTRGQTRARQELDGTRLAAAAADPLNALGQLAMEAMFRPPVGRAIARFPRLRPQLVNAAPPAPRDQPGPPGADGFLAAHHLGAPPAGNIQQAPPPGNPIRQQDRDNRRSNNAEQIPQQPVLHWSQIAAQSLVQPYPASISRTTHGVTSQTDQSEGSRGLEFVENQDGTSAASPETERPFLPSQLSQTQREWLLEADWAMRAFLQSYMLSIVDNKSIFQHVKVFNFAFLSSRFIPILSRSDFWSSFPVLEELTLHISPDWRMMERYGNDILDKSVKPSEACDPMFWLLHNFIGQITSLKTLDIGWIRNINHPKEGLYQFGEMLPAPVVPLEDTHRAEQKLMVDLLFVEHLKLTHCYLTPATLKNIVHNLQSKSMCELTLTNVSLTADRSTNFLRRSNRPTRDARGLLPEGPQIRTNSWVAVLNEIGPTKMIEDLEPTGSYSPNGDGQDLRLLERINIVNCGYATSALAAELDFQANNPANAPQAPNGLNALPLRRQMLQDLAPVASRESTTAFMKSNDPHLGFVVHEKRQDETECLQLEFGMRLVHNEDEDDGDGDDSDSEFGGPLPGDNVNGWALGAVSRFSGTLTRD